jgi:nucleoside-diphosphate-sugar epimerase
LLQCNYWNPLLNNSKPSARLIFAYSSQVYTRVNSKTPIRKTGKAIPNKVYGVSKQSEENLIRNSGIPFLILRMSSIYGPGCRPNYNSVVATLSHRAIKSLPLVINGDGQQCIGFVYIVDVVRVFMLAGCESLGGSAKIFNVSSGQMVSLKKIVKQISRFQKNTKVEFLMDKKNSEISYSYDPSKFSKKYGWRPKVSLVKEIEQNLSYFRGKK